MRIESSSDISVYELRTLVEILPSEWQTEVSEEQYFMKSMEVPSWITLAAHAPWWIQCLGGAASVYVTGIISEAGKDTWRNRKEIVQAAGKVIAPIERLASFISSSIASASPKNFAVLAIPLGQGFHNVHLKLDYQSQDELEFQIAMFVHHVPAIEALIKAENLNDSNAVGGVFLEFGANDYSLLASWLDRASLERREVVLS